jgi:hypothetical protein
VPVPKVIDLGIAKATEGRLTDNTVYTQLHQFIGTPERIEDADVHPIDFAVLTQAGQWQQAMTAVKQSGTPTNQYD